VSAPRRTPRIGFVLIAVLLAFAVAATSATASTDPGATASKKRCPKGKKLKTVKKKGKKVKRCRKVKAQSGGGGGGGAAPLFEPPGRQLSGNDAVPFLQRYLFNSTFTDCPAGWPNCAVEERYSHTADGSFYYCRLTSTSGSDIINGARAYQVQNAVVEADGSWAFNEIVDNYGNPSFYEWHVSTNGAVTGVYQYNGTQQIGPLQYVPGARDCSY
jgi:hypothetical protein